MIFKEIEDIVKNNIKYREVFHTGIESQLVLMSIAVEDEIGEEIHQSSDQIIFIMDGKAAVELNGKVEVVNDDSLIFIPAGTLHNIVNIGNEDLKLLSIYAPPVHLAGTVHDTKEDEKNDELDEAIGSA